MPPLVAYSTGMPELAPIQGELQAQIMSALWGQGQGTVEQVRAALPKRHRGAYTTVQTVLNRLVDRGMLTRRKIGNSFVYAPRLSEGEYVSKSIARTLAGASSDARQVALARLVGRLERGELDELQKLAREIDRRRGR